MSDPALAPNAVVFDWAWSLAATPEQLWPLVSDTNRINQLARMAPATFVDAPNAEGGATRTGETSQLGMGVTWDEHPFEWVYPNGFTVLREFHNGVLSAYRSTVTLTPEGTGTRLSHRVDLLPRLGLMAIFVQREGAKQQKSWEHAYKTIDAFLTAGGPWPFGPSRPIKLSAEGKAFESAFRAESDEPELERRLFEHVLKGADDDLIHLRPHLLADRWRVERAPMLESCHYAVRRKLLTPQWSLLCPHCRGAKGTAARLKDVARSVYCASCNINFEAVSDESIELTFRPHPNYRRVQEATYCVGGPGATSHIFFQSKVPAVLSRDVNVSLDPGRYRLRSPRLKEPFSFSYHQTSEAPEERPVVEASPNGFSSPTLHFEGPKLSFSIANHFDYPLEVMIEACDWRDDVLTVAQLRDQPDLLATFGGA